MKRIIVIIACLTLALFNCFAQENITPVKYLVEKYTSGEFTTRAQFMGVENYGSLLFLVKDQGYVVPIKLMKADLGAEKRFRELNLNEGDTLVVRGQLNKIRTKNGRYKGLQEAVIEEVSPNQFNIYLAKHSYLLETPAEESLEEEAIPFEIVETKPSFQGGSANEFSRWVNEHLIYPEIARDNGVQGRVLISFTVDPKGRVKNVKVISGVDPSLDKEAVRVVSKSPRWEPGKQRNRPVAVTYNFPVIFQLQ